jgi:hypothetical protein
VMIRVGWGQALTRSVKRARGGGSPISGQKGGGANFGSDRFLAFFGNFCTYLGKVKLDEKGVGGPPLILI